jgi:hypothetical protein
MVWDLEVGGAERRAETIQLQEENFFEGKGEA